MNTKRMRELQVMLESAARAAMQPYAMEPCDDRTKAQVTQALLCVIGRNYPDTRVKVIDKTPKTLEEKVAFELMDMNDPTVMHFEIQLTPPTLSEYIRLDLQLDRAEANLSVRED